MDPPTYPFEETSFMDDPLHRNKQVHGMYLHEISHLRIEKVFLLLNSEGIFCKTLVNKFYSNSTYEAIIICK